MHLIVGPDRHGVVRHGSQIAAACGHRVVRLQQPADLRRDDLAGADVVHVPFTDRLFGPTIEVAVAEFAVIAAVTARAGAALSVTLHDVPHDDSDLQQRRRNGYRAVVALARGVVVNSDVELALLADDGAAAWSVRRIRLPVFDRVPSVPHTRSSGLVLGVLGFVFPDRGYEDVLRAAPPGSVVRAIGEPARGHEGLVAELSAFAHSRDISFEMTGYVPDADLAAALADVDVPIAPNRRVTASASINTWATHGRRVLVPDAPYTRELLRDAPDRLLTYTDLSAAIAEPGSTWLPEATAIGPSLADVAADYRDHLEACRPPRPVPVEGGWTVPGNRWDLLADTTSEPPSVSVVVPYYRDQEGLDRLLIGLAKQTHPASRLEIVIADDGSPQPPVVPSGVRVVRQDDRGFRAAAARNLGVAASEGEVVVFLDGDMVPEPEFVERLCALPAVAPDAVTVGRRRHRDPVTGDELPEPAWLADAYAASRDLLDADLRSYRFVISAVMALRRDLFTEVGGFDESFTRYGGEDWELAHRLRTAGALLAHRRDAVAWHDGPDWAARATSASRTADKDAERAALARLLPDPVERGGGRWARPAVVVRLTGTDVTGLREAVDSAADVDCGFWHADPTLAATIGAHEGEPTTDVLARAGFEVVVDAPADLRALWRWCLLADRVGTVVAGPVRVDASGHVRRERRHGLPAAGLAGRRDVAQSP